MLRNYFASVRQGVWALVPVEPEHLVLVGGRPLYEDELEDDEPVCYCRRCLLHDDPAGCLVRFPPPVGGWT